MVHNMRTPQLRRWSILLLFALLTIALYKFPITPTTIRNFYSTPPPPKVHLVLATTSGRDYTWTSRLTIPNVEIIAYMADDQKAQYHPEQNKGNEATMYLSYITSFYNTLPDIVIFVHGDDFTWHMDGALSYSTLEALNRLSLPHVQKRKYMNLRTSWENACPNWINTSISVLDPDYNGELKGEEPFVKDAFQSVFGPEIKVPEVLAGPCCSQFAVSKAAILRNTQGAYSEQLSWLLKTPLPDSISGRIWEHFWQFVFLGKAIDCEDERVSLCKAFHICFETQVEWEEWKHLEKERKEMFDMKWELVGKGFEEGGEALEKVEKKLEGLGNVTVPWRERAIERGKSERGRKKVIGDR